jgi:hypothetical protein
VLTEMRPSQKNRKSVPLWYTPLRLFSLLSLHKTHNMHTRFFVYKILLIKWLRIVLCNKSIGGLIRHNEWGSGGRWFESSRPVVKRACGALTCVTSPLLTEAHAWMHDLLVYGRLCDGEAQGKPEPPRDRPANGKAGGGTQGASRGAA